MAFLDGVKVIEVADELGEYCGKQLAGLGADVIKVEPPGGEATRGYGPFYGDIPDREGSLYFWHYNFGKRGIALDLDSADGQHAFRRLAATADIVIETRHKGYMRDRGLDYETLRSDNPGLIYARVTPFGDDGPWADFVGSDLVHLALGGVVMNCGYDPMPDGTYDLPPIAPQMWHAYHIAGEMTVIGVLGALGHRLERGTGQYLSTAVHEAVSKNTETDAPNWVYLRQSHRRQTCRHSLPIKSAPALSRTKDGRWVLPYRTYLLGMVDPWDGTVRLLEKYGLAEDLASAQYNDPAVRRAQTALDRIDLQIDRLTGSMLSSAELWKQAQAQGLPWAPIRRPEENVDDPHWRDRETFIDVPHPDLGRTLTHVGAKWHAPGIPWRTGPVAPTLNRDAAAVFAELEAGPRRSGPASNLDQPAAEPRLSSRGKPFALSGVRVIDLSWLVASAGAGRFLTALGAEVIKVEHHTRWDGMRWGTGAAPIGGRAERERATGPIPSPPRPTPNQSGMFSELNAGKLGISLNLKTQRGREILEQLIASADMLVEGFSPRTMERLGLGYERLREINPRLIYVQQSGMGKHGRYSDARSFGPTAQAMAGLSEMSGLPEPYAPAGIGYSYLDWFGAYNMAISMLAGLYRQRTTGLGCYIDSSQVEVGTYLTGTAVLDYSANGRRWARYGNRSPHKPAAPHGIYRVAGTDRWLAVSCFTDEQWTALCQVIGGGDLTSDDRFNTWSGRLEHQDELDAVLGQRLQRLNGTELMLALQARHVPAGICQTAEDRYEHDPQLKFLEWLVEIPHSEIGTWPIKEVPVQMSDTPFDIGGLPGRAGPCYGEDNDYVYEKILGLDKPTIQELIQQDVIGDLPSGGPE